MNHRRSHRLLAASSAAAGVVSVALGIVSLNRLQSSAFGGPVVASTIGSTMSLGIVAAGTLVLLILELAHVTWRRRERARLDRASGAGGGGTAT